MVDLRQLRSQIKDSLDRERVIDILSFIGYEVRRDFKFCLRDEKTPSASIRADGYIKDFGSEWGGDIVALLHDYKNMSLKDATEYVADCLGISYE